MKNEIIYDLSLDEYHRGVRYGTYVSSTQLKWYLSSPRYFRYMYSQPAEETEATRFGSLFHECMAALRGNDIEGSLAQWRDSVMCFAPPVNKATGKPYGTATLTYQEHYRNFIEKAEGHTVATAEDLTLVCDMVSSLTLSPGATSEQVRKLLRWGNPEVSIFHQSEDIRLKCRPDRLTGSKIIDWKTTTLCELNEESINRVILRYGYHISAAMYQYIVHEATGKWYDFFLVFVQKQPPYDCVMVDMANYGYKWLDSLEMIVPGPGALEFRQLLGLHIRCSKERQWPGAETFISGDKYRIMEIVPPRYYARKFEEDEF